MSQTSDVLKPSTPDHHSLTLAELRQITLDAAGFEPAEVGAMVRLGVEKLKQKLEATKTQFFAHEGVVIDEKICADNTAQLKAATELIAIGADVMALRRRSTENDGGKRQEIKIDLSGWTVTAPTEPKQV